MATATMTSEQMAHEERRYIQVFIWLAILTALEIGCTFLPLSHFVIGVALVLLAASKASLVALYFMHLKFEPKSLGRIVSSTLILGCILVGVGLAEVLLPRP